MSPAGYVGVPLGAMFLVLPSRTDNRLGGYHLWVDETGVLVLQRSHTISRMTRQRDWPMFFFTITQNICMVLRKSIEGIVLIRTVRSHVDLVH